LTDQQWTPAAISSKTSATPTQWDWLSIAGKVIYLNVFKRDNEVSDKRILERQFEVMLIMPVVGKDIEAA
jgi:hypothetical protein